MSTICCLLGVLLLLFANMSHEFATSAVPTSEELCWSDADACSVQATLRQATASPSSKDTLPLNIDCLEDKETASNHLTEGGSSATPTTTSSPTLLPTFAAPSYLWRIFEHAHAITLNGCHTSKGARTFGLEYLPQCDKIAEITIEKFHVDALMPLCCSSALFMQLETLRFENNEISTVGAESLSNLALLRNLQFSHNSLQSLEHVAFDKLPFLEHLKIEEPSLELREADFFQRCKLKSLWMLDLKLLNVEVLQALPKTLLELHVENSTFNGNVDSAVGESREVEHFLNISNAHILSNISIINCNVSSLTLQDDSCNLRFLNLSGNALKDLKLYFGKKQSATESPLDESESEEIASTPATSSLEVLDLSSNKLTALPFDWLNELRHLQILKLDHNLLKTLSLSQLHGVLPAMPSAFVDLSHNKLRALADTADYIDCERIRLGVDGNPWNCMWLLDFAQKFPEKFRILKYDKFLSQININGLECLPTETLPFGLLSEASTTPSANAAMGPIDLTKTNATSPKSMNISTYTLVWGNPYNKPKSQRANALIIVFMLPVGIAILFVLLYLWIYCQRIFHLSYYRSSPLCGLCLRKNPSIVMTPPGANRFDVVRQLPPQTTLSNGNFNYLGNGNGLSNNNENYEMPVNGLAPDCNCPPAPDGSACRCEKTHHITYVAGWPSEKPQKIYEEIIEVELPEINSRPDDPIEHKNSMYDHLRFE